MAKRQSALDAPFGGRLLKDQESVFDHNAWDNVPWNEEQEEEALKMVAKQAENPVPEDQRETYNENAAQYWDKFYSMHTNQFFKDRHWLRQEFPELFEAEEGKPSKRAIFEIGCGAGNTPEYNESRCKAFVYDVTSPSPPAEIEPGTIDVCICIFVLSALKPTTWETAASNIYKLLKPGGLVVFRDYGRFDLAQLRFKKGRMLGDNFYIRGDGTQVYFFTQEDVNKMFNEFEVIQNAVDRRLLVNRRYVLSRKSSL
ncbi:hypothetical protein HDV05_005925 [Chytridiales sp. JEL 0842]|nr:hypothetical protein HDV05_005925 [Chytridiales sp. JEL 0842]